MANRRVDLTGKRFGRLAAVRFDSIRKGSSAWLCRCDCGNEIVAMAYHLKRGATTSCGCYRVEASADRVRTHGLTRSPTYLTWVSMIQRCENPEATGYEYYGAIGVTVCAAWHDFETFLADMGERPAGRTLDRRDPHGNYERDNCRWATPLEQANNKRKST